MSDAGASAKNVTAHHCLHPHEVEILAGEMVTFWVNNVLIVIVVSVMEKKYRVPSHPVNWEGLC